MVTFADLGEAACPFAIVLLHAALRGKNFGMLASDRISCEAGLGGNTPEELDHPLGKV